MYCPKCRKIMSVNARGELVCDAGGMTLDRPISDAFREHFGDRVRPSPSKNWKVQRVGGVWFCPKCGKRMSEEDGKIECHACGADLTNYVFDLIELYPHRRENVRHFDYVYGEVIGV